MKLGLASREAAMVEGEAMVLMGAFDGFRGHID